MLLDGVAGGGNGARDIDEPCYSSSAAANSLLTLDINPIPAWSNTLRDEIWSRYFGFQDSTFSNYHID